MQQIQKQIEKVDLLIKNQIEHDRGDAWRLLKNCLGAPKTTTCERGRVCLATVRLGAKCHT
jgi:hypothetical protein